MAGRGQGCLPRVQGRGRLRHLSVGLRVRRHVRALRPRADGEVPVEQFYYGGAGCMYVACPRNRVSPDPSWDQVRWSECAIGAGRMPASCQGGISACPFFSPQPPPRTLLAHAQHVQRGKLGGGDAGSRCSSAPPPSRHALPADRATAAAQTTSRSTRRWSSLTRGRRVRRMGRRRRRSSGSARSKTRCACLKFACALAGSHRPR